MKKAFLILLSMLLLLCSCGTKKIDKYSDYEHYALEEFDLYFNHFPYSVVRKDMAEGSVQYLLYQFEKDKYIIIEEISGGNKGDVINENNTYFYKNHLYVLRGTPYCAEDYELNEASVKSKSMILDTTSIDKERLDLKSITKVDDKYIYYEATLKNGNKVNIKCLLNDYKCELYKKN